MSNLSEEEKKTIGKTLEEHIEFWHKAYNDTFDELQKEKGKNKELNLENQALYESINCNDDNMLARRYEKLQKENNELRDTNKKLYELGKQKAIQEILNENWVSKDKIKDKIKELKQDLEYQMNNYGFSVEINETIKVLEDLLKEN